MSIITGILLLIAAIILAAALAAMFRGKKRGEFDVKSRNPNEFESPVTPQDDTNVHKDEFTLNDKGEEKTSASQPANPTDFSLKDEDKKE